MRRPFLLGVLATLAVGAVVGSLVVWSGIIDVSATNAGGFADRVLAYASTRSIRHHAKDEKNPLVNNPAALKRGLQHYRAMCVACHGGPGAESEEFAAGLHPSAPDLASPEVQWFTDGMLYETIARGIGSTGMPAFGPTRQSNDIWSIVAFVRHLPALTPEEKTELGRKGLGGNAESSGKPSTAPSLQSEAGAATTSSGGKNERVHRVSIANFKFDPATLEVSGGDIIVWANTDFVAHTATADDRTFDTGKLEGGESKRVIATKKGTFPYSCRYHIAMRGTLIVR